MSENYSDISVPVVFAFVNHLVAINFGVSDDVTKLLIINFVLILQSGIWEVSLLGYLP